MAHPGEGQLSFDDQRRISNNFFILMLAMTWIEHCDEW